MTRHQYRRAMRRWRGAEERRSPPGLYLAGERIRTFKGTPTERFQFYDLGFPWVTVKRSADGLVDGMKANF